jgi:prepilin-type N-terminal cleavage/methylation domain-containing protein
MQLQPTLWKGACIVRSNHPRDGFTLIELLVVIAIIVILMALTLPAIQKVRAAADKLRCANNLKQIGIALHNYAGDHGGFPPGGFYPAGVTGSSWSVQARILPYIEQDSLQKLIDFSLPYSAQPLVTQARVNTYICPSDSKVRQRVDGSLIHFPLNYVANMGSWLVFHQGSGFAGDGTLPPSNRSAHLGVTFAAIRDGTSNTIGFSECKSYQAYLRDSGNPDGPGIPEPSSPTAVAGYGGNFKLDSGHTEWVDARIHQTGFTTTFTPNTRVPYTSGGEEYDVDFSSSREGTSLIRFTYAVVTARSYHPQCVNALLMDGSVHAFRDSIDLAVWRALGTRAGGEHVPAEVFD